MRFCGDNILAYNAKDLYPTLYDDVALELSGKKLIKTKNALINMNHWDIITSKGNKNENNVFNCRKDNA